MAVLTKTQIRAIINKLRAKGDAVIEALVGKEPDNDKRDEEQLKHFEKMVRDSNLPSGVAKFICAQIDSWCIEYLFDEHLTAAAAKALKFPGMDQDWDSWNKAYNAKKGKLADMLTDLEFELTMAGRDDYEQYMVVFEKQLNKL